MNNTDLFNFLFVDRSNEKLKLDKFLRIPTYTILWIKGKRGFGKTEFLKYVLSNRKEYSLCYIDVKINTNAVDIISNFITELQNNSSINFMENIKKNYKKFYNSTLKKVKEINFINFPQIHNIVSMLLDTSYLVITSLDEQKSSFDLIQNYIDMILKNQKLFICIDNFSRCDNETAQLFFQVFKKYIETENLKSCIITAYEDLSVEMKEKIFHNLPYTEIEIQKLDNVSYFYQIMEPIFDLSSFREEDIEYIYKKCNGSPKKLSTFISKILEHGGIKFTSEKKAKIIKKVMMDVLQGDHIKFTEKDFTPIQKWILFSFLCLGEQVPVELLLQLALYISKKCYLYYGYNEQKFYEQLPVLTDNNILKYNIDNTITCYHDMDYLELLEIFQESMVGGLFSQITYEFLINQKNFEKREELLCYHAKKANILGWEIKNFRYGKKLFYNNQVYDAQKVFNSFEGCLNNFNPIQILFIGLVSYETGNFQQAIQYLRLINPQKLKYPKLKYYYYFFIGKSYNNIGDTKQAVHLLEKAIIQTNKDSEIYAHTLNILHMYYFEIPERIQEAEKTFFKIKKFYKELYPSIWANTMRGAQNFLDNEEALQVLEEASTLLESELEKAFLQTTKGFVYVKLNQLDKAEKEFQQSCEIIKRLKMHEFTYAANNLAVCYMIKEKYYDAKKILLEALLWNRTHYGSIVLQIHLMFCCLYLAQKDEAIHYYKALEYFGNSTPISDPIMNRKLYLNLAIASNILGNSIMKEKYYSKAKNFINNSSSEWRFYVLTQSTETPSPSKPSALYMQIKTFDPWFLIYAHD